MGGYSDNSAAGSPFLWDRIYSGPSLGFIRRPINPDFEVITSTYAIQPFDFQLLLNLAAIQTITLPDLNVWCLNGTGGTPLIIKDKAGNATTYNKTILPFNGSQLIDGLASVQLVTDFQSWTFRPRSDRTGWYMS